jgi:ABC-type glycerol-3-phosphate transport system permease component
MSTELATREVVETAPPIVRQNRSQRSKPNVAAGIAACIWLMLVGVPIYFIVATSFRTHDQYVSAGPLDLPTSPTLHNYANAFELGFATLLRNSVTVTVGTVVIVLALALPASYAIVRAQSRTMRFGFNVFLLGLAIPAQAVIIPIYLIITKLSLYDTPTAIILPTAAFSLPMSVVVLTSTLRDVPNELYEAMTVDGAGNGVMFWRLVLPLARPGLISVGIFAGLNGWNGFLFPLILTQATGQRVLSLGLWNFQSQYGTDVPGLMAEVVLSALPVLLLYLFGRRHLLSGLAAGFGK